MSTDTPDPRVLAIYASAKTKAREIGRWDADHAIYDLLASELSRDVFNAAAWYLANDTSATLSAFWAVIGGRSEYSHWVMDIVDALGTWVKWDLGDGVQYGLSSFEPWTPPTKPLTAAEKRARRPGPYCGVPGHGSWLVDTDPRGSEYPLDPKTSITVCADCFDNICITEYRAVS